MLQFKPAVHETWHWGPCFMCICNQFHQHLQLNTCLGDQHGLCHVSQSKPNQVLARRRYSTPLRKVPVTMVLGLTNVLYNTKLILLLADEPHHEGICSAQQALPFCATACSLQMLVERPQPFTASPGRCPGPTPAPGPRGTAPRQQGPSTPAAWPVCRPQSRPARSLLHGQTQLRLMRMVLTLVLLSSGCSSTRRMCSHSTTEVSTDPESYGQPIANRLRLLGIVWHRAAGWAGAPTMAVTSLLYTQSRCCADTTSRNRPRHSVLFMVTCGGVGNPMHIHPLRQQQRTNGSLRNEMLSDGKLLGRQHDDPECSVWHLPNSPRHTPAAQPRRRLSRQTRMLPATGSERMAFARHQPLYCLMLQSAGRQRAATCAKVSEALRCCLRPANLSEDSSSLALLASGVSTKPTKNAGMPLACMINFFLRWLADQIKRFQAS
jgi:hypothetical protein